MWCIAGGSKQSGAYKHPLRISKIVEYLSYDLTAEVGDICADIALMNLSDNPTPLRFLHRGNLTFENHTKDGTEDMRYTPLLRDIVGVRDSFSTNVCSLAPFTRLIEPPSPDVFVPFSMYETAPFVPGEKQLIRIFGRLRGASYQRLIYGPHYKRLGRKPEAISIPVYGGDVLLGAIQREDLAVPSDSDVSVGKECHAGDYRRLLQSFTDDYMDYPETYHIIVDALTRDGRHLTVSPLTPDLRHGCTDQELGDRRITHYWSKSSVFIVESKLNGPQLVMEATEAEVHA